MTQQNPTPAFCSKEHPEISTIGNIGNVKIAGWLLLISLVISIFHGFYPVGEIVLSGILSVCAAFFLFHRLIRIQKLQVAVLSFIGLLSILISGGEIFPLLGRAITANNALITLIISVGFLRLIIKPNQEDEILPKGTKALWKTLIGVHLFGAVINLSAIVIFADRLLKKITCAGIHWANSSHWPCPLKISISKPATARPKCLRMRLMQQPASCSTTTSRPHAEPASWITVAAIST